MWQFAQLLQNSSFSLWTVLSNPQKVQTAWTLDYKKPTSVRDLALSQKVGEVSEKILSGNTVYCFWGHLSVQ